ncbi:LysR substrate-binding domain-containing protein [Actinomadura madurae]|uniref:LysR substrate-binding domain-containing protein n=1 Tax=Actinomadura madurae TaxID=1993 RepID=UPI0035588ADA
MRVGFLLPTGGEALSHLIRAYEARHPGRRLSLSNVPYADLYEPLRGNEIDVLISYLVLDRDEQSDLTAGPAIDHTARVLVAAAADPLAAKDSISVEDLAAAAPARCRPGSPASSSTISCRRPPPRASRSIAPTTSVMTTPTA